MLEQLRDKGIHKNTIKEALKGIKENTQATNGKIRLNGAVVTGTPVELKRFQELDFIRASVLGATIDKY
jgi:homoserine trans-succinylase